MGLLWELRKIKIEFLKMKILIDTPLINKKIHKFLSISKTHQIFPSDYLCLLISIENQKLFETERERERLINEQK